MTDRTKTEYIIYTISDKQNIVVNKTIFCSIFKISEEEVDRKEKELTIYTEGRFIGKLQKNILNDKDLTVSEVEAVINHKLSILRSIYPIVIKLVKSLIPKLPLEEVTDFQQLLSEQSHPVTDWACDLIIEQQKKITNLNKENQALAELVHKLY